MIKIAKIVGRSLGILFELILVFIIVFAFAIRTSPVQTFLAKKATDYLSNELGAKIKIDGVSIIFFNQFALDGILISDKVGDTIIYAKTIYASVSSYDLKKGSFKLSGVDIEETYLNLNRDEQGVYNYQFIKDYFAQTEKTKKKFVLEIEKITLSDIRFRYDDYRREKRESGVDYFHLSVNKINGTVENFQIKDGSYKAEVKALNFVEKSGFVLDDLAAMANVSADGIFLSQLQIKSPGSKIESKKFNMRSTGFIDFLSFEDSIVFDAKIDKSQVDLAEAALFAYALDGMNDTIRLETEVTKKVKNLRLSNFDLKIKDHSRIKGTLNLPDRRSPESAFFHEKLDYVKIDLAELKTIRLPNSAPQSHITINEQISRLQYFEAEDTRLDGFSSQFVIASDIIKTKIGAVRMDNGIMFTQNEKNKSYLFEQSTASEYDVKVEQFNLGVFLNNKDLGLVDGLVFLSGEAFSVDDIIFTSIEGQVNRLDYLDYSYEKIKIIEGTFADKKFIGKIDVKDDNLDMTYDGMVNFKDELHLLFTVVINEAVLESLNITEKSAEITSNFSIDLKGRNPNNFRGTIDMESFNYSENGKSFDIPSLNLEIQRTREKDFFDIRSEVANINLTGKLDITTLLSDFQYQISKVFPLLYSEKAEAKSKKSVDHFEFDIHLFETNEILATLFPDLRIAENTHVSGHYFEEVPNLLITVNSDSIRYTDFTFRDLSLNQSMNANNFLVDYKIGRFQHSDIVNFDDIAFQSVGQNNILNSNLIWDQNTTDPSSINWETTLFDLEHYKLVIEPSHFNIEQYQWEITNTAGVTINSDTIGIQNLVLQRNEQSLILDGRFSNNDEHQLNLLFKEIDLNELSDFVLDVPLEGKLNASGYIANPFNNFQFSGEANVLQLKIKKQLVGDINLNSNWEASNKSIALKGDLIYKGNQTFEFVGGYYPRKEKDNLDFNLVFDYTDIQFANAFLNPEILSDIKGLLKGNLNVSGSPDAPILDGSVELIAGSAKVGILGTHFGLGGPIIADEYGFYINGIPVYDEDGNAGRAIGSVLHNNFSDFNFDLMFDLEEDAVNRNPLNPWMSLPLDRFLVLNSEYKPGDLYYGKGYATGIVNIFGYLDNLEITVDLETQKGTKINIPMYGIGDIDEENNFIVFVDADTTANTLEPRIDFTGVDLDLNFKVTPDAQLKIIFNEELEDEITARGKGDIAIQLDNLGDVSMKGIYTVTEGIYDFAMGPIKQKFFIEEGGNISWTGSPYNAYLDLRTYHKVNANIAVVTNNQFESANGTQQEIYCYLDLTGSLAKPSINFDLEAPGASEASKSIITRIESDPDELNRQFFSLLLWKKFQPLTGTALADGGAALDLVTNQINSILSKVSQDYTLNVDLSSDQLTGENTYEFGVTKGFLDDRLILSGSFGVESQKLDETKDQNALIGDVNLEYLLNETGTFRVEIFNESNDNTIIQSQEQGRFTQGIGISYKEDFHKFKDFKAIQYFLDIFRSKKNKRYPIKRKRQQLPVPKKEGQKDVPDPKNPSKIEPKEEPIP